MLSDDDIQRVAIQCGMKSGQHWNRDRMNTSKMRSFARAIEREVRKQVLEDATQPDAVEALRWEKPGPVSPNHPLECLIVLSALRQSDGDWWIEGNKFLADGLQIAWAPDTPEARAVLAAQGGDR